MRSKYSAHRKKVILSGILMLICIGMLFTPSVQAKGMSAKKSTVDKVRLSKKKLSLKKGKTKTLKLNNTSKKVVWKSSKKSVAVVDNSGVVRAKKVGSCVITAKSGGKKYKCRVTVYKPVSKTQQVKILRKTYKKIKNKKKIILAGSSSIGHWKSASTALAPYKVLNMGIGGSTTKQWLKWYKKLIVAYKPSAVILYPGAGSDIKRTRSAEKTGERVISLLQQLHQELPNVPIFYISIYCNKNKYKFWSLEKACNEIVQGYCSETENLYYIDVASLLINKDKGVPKAGMISGDGEHMTKKGYAIWNKTIAPIVKKTLKRVKKEK